MCLSIALFSFNKIEIDLFIYMASSSNLPAIAGAEKIVLLQPYYCEIDLFLE